MKIRRLIQDRTYFLRLLVSYLCVLLIPTVAISSIAFDSVFRRSEERLMDEVYRNFQASVSGLDQHLQGIDLLRIQLSSDPLFSAHNLGISAYRVMKAQRQLSYYVSTNHYLEDTLFYLRGSDLLFSYQSTFSPDQYAVRRPGYAIWAGETFLDTIQTMRGFALYAPTGQNHPDGTEHVIMLLQIPTVSARPYATLIIPLTQSLLRTAVNLPNVEGSVLLVMDEQDTLVWNALAADAQAIQRTMDALQNEPAIVSLDGVRCIVMRATSSFHGLRFLAAVPVEGLMGDVRAEQAKMLTLLILTFAVGLGLIYLLSRVNYHPLRQISDMLQGARQRPEPVDGNELEVTRSILSDLISQQTVSRAAYERGMVSNLLRGRFGSKEAFDEQGAIFDFSLPFASLRVVALSLEGQGTAVEDWEAHVRAARLPGHTVFYTIEVFPQTLVVLINGNLQADTARLLVEDIIQHIEGTTGYLVTAGISEPVAKLSAVPTAYLQAVTALDLRIILGSRHIFFFSDAIEEAPEEDGRLDAHLQRLRKQMMLGDRERIMAEIDTISAYITTSSPSLFAVRQQFFTVLTAIMAYAQKMPLCAPLNVQKYDLFGVSAIISTQELLRMIHALGREVCEKLPAEGGTDESALLSDMLKYLDVHALSPDFSLKTMAGVFMMSDSSLSRYFKKQTGHNISDYITERRIAEAKRLLSETDLPIREIVERIGYFDVSSFSKKFKRETGVSPSDYRRRE